MSDSEAVGGKYHGFTTEWGPVGFEVSKHPLTIMVSVESLNAAHGKLCTMSLHFHYGTNMIAISATFYCRLRVKGQSCSTIRSLPACCSTSGRSTLGIYTLAIFPSTSSTLPFSLPLLSRSTLLWRPSVSRSSHLDQAITLSFIITSLLYI